MNQAVQVATNVEAVLFVLLGIVTSAQYLSRRESNQGFLALAIGLLAVVVFLSRISAAFHYSPVWLGAASLVGFIGSGYALFRFRTAFMPIPQRRQAVIAGAGLGLTVITVGALLLNGPRNFIGVVAVALIVYWCGLVGEPIVRFYLASRKLPAVQRLRLQSLAAGFGGLVAVVIVSVAAASISRNPLFQLLVQLAVIILIPLLYVSFSPPAWLRRQWRAGEEESLAEATHDLVTFKADQAQTAQQGLGWAMRIIGASAGMILAPSGRVLAQVGIGEERANSLREQYWPPAERLVFGAAAGGSGTVVTLPLATSDGVGQMLLLAGVFSPAFGADEKSRLKQYSAAIVAALERVSIFERLEAANDQLRVADRHKSVFLANMSHELRTPLNSILGFSELLIDDEDDRYEVATRLKFLKQIHGSGAHLLGLINDILDLSKVEAGQMELHLDRIGVDDVIPQVISVVAPLAEKKSITVEARGAPGLELLADAVKLRQMLLNLLSNAIKFTEAGGRVVIEVRAAGEAVEIAVTDTGIGIAAGDLDRIFDEFQQLDGGADRQHEGTGLGLALARKFAELHGGTLTVASRLGEGSTFTLRLPTRAVLSAPEVGAEVATASGDLSRPLVLVVEDNAASAELLLRHLSDAGFRPQLVTSGAEALAIAADRRPAAITLDILLPEMDGWEVLAKLKADERTRDIPVVVVSVVDNPDLGRALGALDYLVKPVERKALTSTLGRLALTSPDAGRVLRVLVVDDEPANLTLLSTMLVPMGFAVETADGGRAGIDAALADPPDLVLLDLMMPAVSGFDVVEALRADARTRDTPILVVTAKDLTPRDRKKLNGDVAGILARNSLATAELVEWLRRLLPVGERVAAHR